MAYVKNTWQTGDTITASKLNNMENGIEAAQGGGGGGSDLPDYSSARKGDALVVNGTSAYKYLAWDSILPAYSTYGSDDGKVLAIDSNHEVSWTTPSGGSGEGVPSYSWQDEGKFLAVSCTSGGQMLRWQEINELPEFSSSNEGQFLAVKESHTYSGTYYIDWETCLPDYSGLSEDKVLKYDVGQGEVTWGDAPNPWQHYGIPEYSYADYPEGSVLAIAAGPSTTCDLEWISILPTYDTSNDKGKVLTIASCGDSLVWSQGLPTDGSGGMVPGALLVYDCSAGWKGLDPTNANDGDVLTLVGGAPEWTELLPAYDTGYDGGKVLTITASGPRWLTPAQ